MLTGYDHEKDSLKEKLQSALAEIERLKAPQKWVKCSERMPTENDTDCNGHVWAWDVSMRKYNPVLRTPLATEKYFTHWRPTGLKRPEPPKEEA